MSQLSASLAGKTVPSQRSFFSKRKSPFRAATSGFGSTGAGAGLPARARAAFSPSATTAGLKVVYPSVKWGTALGRSAMKRLPTHFSRRVVFP